MQQIFGEREDEDGIGDSVLLLIYILIPRRDQRHVSTLDMAILNYIQ